MGFDIPHTAKVKKKKTEKMFNEKKIVFFKQSLLISLKNIHT